MARDLLLISNSTLHGSGYLDHCANEISSLLGSRENVLFVPFARPGGITHDAYTATARSRFEQMGYSLSGVHETGFPEKALRETDAVFIGGGNTFVLLDALQNNNTLWGGLLRERVAAGMPYIGTSAGSNVACNTIATTNDMPIAHPRSLEAYGFVPFNINPHYIDPDPDSTHQGETRGTRIAEFHARHDIPVVALREGAMLRVQGDSMELRGQHGARLFRQGQDPVEYSTGDSLDFLLE